MSDQAQRPECPMAGAEKNRLFFREARMPESQAILEICKISQLPEDSNPDNLPLIHGVPVKLNKHLDGDSERVYSCDVFRGSIQFDGQNRQVEICYRYPSRLRRFLAAKRKHDPPVEKTITVFEYAPTPTERYSV